jgi:hypothetical protein
MKLETGWIEITLTELKDYEVVLVQY